MIRRGIPLLLALLLPCLGRATIYYVSPSGNNANDGQSTNTAWQTISMVNSRTFLAGDRILFQGGMTFGGGKIYFAPGTGGTAGNPIVISSYGSGRATIAPGNDLGFYAYDCAGLVISNVNFTGSGRSTNTSSGLQFYNDGGAGAFLDFIRIADVDVSGFGDTGIILGAWNGNNGYRDARIERAVSHDNAKAGIASYAQFSNLHTNIYVGDCTVHHNSGVTGASGNTGNGIVLGEVNNATIERCVAYTNGGLGNGNVAIWCYDSTRVTIQFCEAFDTRTGGAQDGGGFDIDGGCTFCVIQHCYSHNNDGAGYGIYQYQYAPPFSNNVVRYNISQNDGRKNSYGAISLWDGGGTSTGLRSVEIYNNTIWLGSAASGTPRAVNFITTTTNVHFRNNLFVTTNGLRLLNVVSGQSGLSLQGNDYWSSGGAFVIGWNGTDYASLAAWRAAAAQETNSAGFNVDPGLVSPGTGPSFTNTALLTTLDAYRLKSDSPMIDAGLLIGTLPFNVGGATRDYFGGPLPLGAAFDLGAHETWPTVSLAVTDAVASETNVADTAAFAVTRTGSTQSNLVVNYTLAGTATNGVDYTLLSGLVTITAGTNSASVVLSPIADNLAESNETVLVALSPNSLFTNAVQNAGTMTILDKPIDAWRFVVFGPNANVPSIAGDNADPDGDGLNNLAEYALNLNPQSATRTNLPFSRIENGVLALTWSRATNVPDVSLTVEAAATVTGAWTTNGLVNLPLGSTNGLAWFKTTDAAHPVTNDPSRFLRLRVARVP